MCFWNNGVHYTFWITSKYFNKIEYGCVFKFHLVSVLILHCKDGVEVDVIK